MAFAYPGQGTSAPDKPPKTNHNVQTTVAGLEKNPRIVCLTCRRQLDKQSWMGKKQWEQEVARFREQHPSGQDQEFDDTPSTVLR